MSSSDPSLDNDSNSHDSLFVEIDQILEKTDEGERNQAVRDFLIRRKTELKEHTINTMVSVISPIVKDFIGSDAEIKPILIVDGLKLDDDSIYEIFFSQLFLYRNTPGYN